MHLRSIAAALTAVSALLLGSAVASAAGVKIGVLSDMSGPNADFGGKGSVIATEMAIKDFGGSVLGEPIEMVQADMQSKPDISAGVARRWYENEGVDVIVDINNSTAAIAVNKLAAQFKKIDIVNQGATPRLTREDCTPYSVHYGWNLYALAAGSARAIVQEGGKTWYFITVDYTFGHDMQAIMKPMIEAAGGKVLGSSLHPLNTSDFSTYLLKAKAANPDVIALNNSGQDFTTSLKQAQEFGITESGKRIAGLVVTIADVNSLGLEAAHGLTFVQSFYWDRTDTSRAWSQRFFERFHKMPTAVQASVYSGVLHYLNAVKAAGTKDADAVMAKMKSMPVHDMYTDGQVRADGLLVHDMYLFQVKTPGESKGAWDYFKVLRTIPGEEAYQPVAPDLCKFLASK